MTSPEADHARAAYEALAPGYDSFTAHHDHERWTEVVEGAARDAGLQGARLLDVGCGTGSSLPPMLARGYEVTGVDISPAMLAVAERKVGARARLVAADMRSLPVLGEYDLVWSLGDALNYLDGADELVAALGGMRRNLAPGGVVAFDVNTLATFRLLYSSMLVVPSAEQVTVLEGRGDDRLPSGGAAIAWIDRLEPDGTGWWRRTRSTHHHRHHSEETMRAALAAAGLACHSVAGTTITGATRTPLDELSHSKALYTARQGARPSEQRR